MDSMKYDGVGSFQGGEYENVNVDGVVSCKGDLKANTMEVDGVFTCHGNLEVGSLDCDGVSEFKGVILAKRIYVDGVMNQKEGSKIGAEEIVCDGVINCKGEISADKVEADGHISASEIVGESIKINSRRTLFGIQIGSFGIGPKRSNIDLIEATNIEIVGVRAKEVNGEHIIIGPRCKIEKVDCNGTLYIDKSATVDTISGEYELKSV